MLEKQAHICSLLVSRASPRKGEEEEERLRRAGWVLGSFDFCWCFYFYSFFSVPWQTLVETGGLQILISAVIIS